MSDPVEVRVEKRFRHPPERVFDAFLDPATVGLWLFHTPEGVMEKTDYEPVVGGAFAIFERRGDDLARHPVRSDRTPGADRLRFPGRRSARGTDTRDRDLHA
ncbi:SRPBCC family protein [Brevundimonas goettingensis]|uniref:SRPBCC domain-containing protein n=1 Tax=Brevundimonas goettingensis TaxID=2774190 RepID=A0A975C078_9CAUL|nr:SRPBCC domain-containing protein [Brevundimonas goettingensis]QTC91398.1 SRPBCC domain-containing protein [Brevundimonas goettingensis]